MRATFRYDNLSSVLLKIDEQTHAKSKHDRTPGEYPTQLAELRAEVVSLKAENERMVERLTDELNRLAERLEELEARAHRPWWGRVFNRSGQEHNRPHNHVGRRWQGSGHFALTARINADQSKRRNLSVQNERASSCPRPKS